MRPWLLEEQLTSWPCPILCPQKQSGRGQPRTPTEALGDTSNIGRLVSKGSPWALKETKLNGGSILVILAVQGVLKPWQGGWLLAGLGGLAARLVPSAPGTPGLWPRAPNRNPPRPLTPFASDDGCCPAEAGFEALWAGWAGVATACGLFQLGPLETQRKCVAMALNLSTGMIVCGIYEWQWKTGCSCFRGITLDLPV